MRSARSLRLTLVATALIGGALFAGTASERAAGLGPVSTSDHCEQGQAAVHASVGGGEGSVSPDEACLSEPGTVAFAADPAPGWSFEAWRGDCSDTGGNQCWVNAEPPNQYRVEAFFKQTDSPPTTPGNLHVVGVGQTHISIAWDPSEDDVGVTGYEVAMDAASWMATTETAYTFNNLTCGTAYPMYVRAVDGSGNYSGMAAVEASTTECAGDQESPSTPMDLTVASAEATRIALRWTASSDNVGVTGYDVFVNGSPAGTVAGTSHSFNELSCAKGYMLGVRARDAAGNVSEIATTAAATAACPAGGDGTAPAVPEGLSMTSATATTIAVSWRPATDNVAVTGYDVFVNGAHRATVVTTSATVGELGCAMSYTIGVRARDAAGNVSGTTAITAATAACPDGTPADPGPQLPPPGDPIIGDTATPPGPDELPPPTSDLLASVAGTGSGKIVVDASGRVFYATAAAPIACGAGSFRCAARLPSGTSVRLVARAAPGSRFARWNGACSGTAPACRVELSATKQVQAVFAPRDARSLVAVSVTRPRVSVRWSRSVGRAAIVVRGRVARAAVLRVQIRRPGGGPLVTQVTPVLAGRFRLVPRLAPGLLPRGASVFPGGFVVTVRGRSGQLRVPLQIQTVVLPAPPEGVVRRVFASGTEGGPAAPRLPAAATEAWAHFRFEAQPRAGQELTVAWYRPDGTRIGVVDKANRPEVVSYLRCETGIASGAYRAELRAGARIVKVLSVRIG